MTPCTEAAVAAPNHTMHPVPDHVGMVATTLRVLPGPDGLHKAAPDGTHAAQPCRQVLPVDNHPGVYCDAYVADGDRLIFASLVGRSGKIMAMYGVIVAGLDRYFRVDGRIFDIDKSLEKRQTKLPASCRYGKDCVHAMLYTHRWSATTACNDGRCYATWTMPVCGRPCNTCPPSVCSTTGAQRY